jgi:hypothetical protein
VQPRLIEPSHVLGPEVLSGLYSSALSPDGTRAYANLHTRVLDAGGAISHHAPDLAAAAAALLTLVMLIPIVRRMRRPQVVGESYCRRCNYHLAAHAGGPCPECGLEQSKVSPVKGRRIARRIAGPFAIILLGVALFGVVRFVGRGSPYLDPDWTLSAEYSWLKLPTFKWAARFVTMGERLVEVDTTSGEVVRTIVRRRAPTYVQLELTPDGRGVYLVAPKQKGLDLVSVASGRVRSKFRPGGTFLCETGGRSVIGHSPDGESAVVSYWDSSDDAHAAVWNLRDGSHRVIASTRAYIEPAGGRNSNWGRQFVLSRWESAPEVISVPLFMESFPTKSYRVRLFDQAGSPLSEYDIVKYANHTSVPVVYPGGEAMFVTAAVMGGISIIDPGNGALLQKLILPGNDQAWDKSTLSPGASHLVIPGFKNVYVRDLRLKAWVMTLSKPRDLIAPRPHMDEGCTRAIAVSQISRRAGAGTALGNQALIVWDLKAKE